MHPSLPDATDARQDLARADFPLPTLGPRLEAIRDAVVFGRGFHLLRGFPVDRLTRAEVVAAWFGFGLYWGKARSQNARGHVVSRRRWCGAAGVEGSARPARSWQGRWPPLPPGSCAQQQAAHHSRHPARRLCRPHLTTTSSPMLSSGGPREGPGVGP